MTLFRTFSEFVSDVQDEFPAHKDDIAKRAVNNTLKSHGGHSDTLYQVEFAWFAIEYKLNKRYILHFNGVKGEGDTIEKANEDHTKKYNNYI